MSTTMVETWSGADLSAIGPIYPMVGSELLLWIIGMALWVLWHVAQARIERRELEADEAAARSPERLKRVFEEEAHL